MGQLKDTFLRLLLAIAPSKPTVVRRQLAPSHDLAGRAAVLATPSQVAFMTCLLAFLFAFTVAVDAKTLPQSSADPVASQPTSPERDWKTGKALTRALDGPAAAAWTDAPFAERIKALAARKGIAVYVDRRIDPTLKTNIQKANVTVAQLLLAVATEQGIGMCRLDDLIYFGPMQTAYGLPIAWLELPRIPRSTRSTLSWQRLSTPRDVLQELAQKHGITIAGADELGYDLWPAGSYPSLTPAQQVALVAVGFGAWPEADESRSRTLKLVPWTPPLAGTIEYAHTELSRNESTQLKRRLRKEFPDVKFQVSKRAVKMTGKASSLYAATKFLIGRNSIEQPNPSDIRFTLKTSATGWQILRAIANQTGRKLELKPSVRPLLNQQVDIECRDLTLAQVVQQVIGGTGLSVKITDSAIELHEE